jgi:hypothetical protein
MRAAPEINKIILGANRHSLPQDLEARLNSFAPALTARRI